MPASPLLPVSDRVARSGSRPTLVVRSLPAVRVPVPPLITCNPLVVRTRRRRRGRVRLRRRRRRRSLYDFGCHGRWRGRRRGLRCHDLGLRRRRRRCRGSRLRSHVAATERHDDRATREQRRGELRVVSHGIPRRMGGRNWIRGVPAAASKRASNARTDPSITSGRRAYPPAPRARAPWLRACIVRKSVSVLRTNDTGEARRTHSRVEVSCGPRRPARDGPQSADGG
jgi:hypothetical protein